MLVSTSLGMCNLSTLEIMSDPEFFEPKTDCSGFNMGYWRLQNISFIHQLKDVTIEELSIGSNGIRIEKEEDNHNLNSSPDEGSSRVVNPNFQRAQSDQLSSLYCSSQK
ncbi:unnamed protein product [Prunus armeniaca]|uniref:Uncharacterized protein n=1 Tax=Prunus armeniaca TaxID=36596 RepID=A0A6J5XZS3_PRUAR|nr:unnamed protein product [Prunus armeniaca]